MSCPSRGTWIEICPVDYEEIVENVVPLTGHVDRNFNAEGQPLVPAVVPLTGHVDRNVGEIPDWAADTDVVPLTGDRGGKFFLKGGPPKINGRAPHRGPW